MTDGTYDPALFGAWTKRCVYGEALTWDAEPSDDEIRLILDRKSADMPAGEELADMLNGMTRELREQMQMFQMLRQQTDRRPTEAGEEIDRKAAQADAKASIEAMSLIVRTLEKIDSLQRTLAQDRERRDAEALDDAGYQSLLDTLEALVEQRAVERSRERDMAPAQDGGERDGAIGAGCAAGAVALAGDGSVPAISRSGNPLAPYG
ncbi:hypothetical protein [Rhizobium sp. PP-CC-3G-465]|uniref:hypothetical protein n=1 Tax=Rhizobium sp. PP-CC-3G-465 TaxID=2135648 RepID=UPI00104B4C05|nr:hypothetical protein C8J33_1011580 [Rhizobium sp. PP-CC-3G-465]